MALFSMLKLPTQIPLIFRSILWLLNCSTSCSGGYILLFSCFKKVQKNWMIKKERILLFDFTLGLKHCIVMSMTEFAMTQNFTKSLLWLYTYIYSCIYVVPFPNPLAFLLQNPTQLFYFSFKLEAGGTHLTIHNIQSKQGIKVVLNVPQLYANSTTKKFVFFSP